MTKSEYVLYVI